MSTHTLLPYKTGPVRDYLFPLGALLISLTLPFEVIVILFVIIGQAHFMMGYWYQYKAGKMNRTYVFAASVLAFSAAIYFMVSGAFGPLFILIGLLFSAHFAHDEIMLHGEQRTLPRLITVAGFVGFFAVLESTFIGSKLPSGYEYVGILIPLVALGIRFLISSERLSQSERYLLYTEVILIVIALATGNPASGLAAIVLLHAANWYVGYDSRLRSNPARRRAYWVEVVAWLAALSSLFFVFMYTSAPVLEALFRVRYYYAWAIAHIVLSYIASLPRASRAVVGTI